MLPNEPADAGAELDERHDVVVGGVLQCGERQGLLVLRDLDGLDLDAASRVRRPSEAWSTTTTCCGGVLDDDAVDDVAVER